MNQFDRFDAVVKLRSGGAFVPRIEALRWEGRCVRGDVLYALEDRSPYGDGEMACSIDDWNGERFPTAWIASGDLQIIAIDWHG